MTMPKYSQPLGTEAYNTIALNPPLLIEDQVVHCFPLRANLSVLQSFVDSYLNVIPPELGRFRAFMPYVQLMIIDYGALASKSANMGWLAEREVMFTVSVEWYRVVGNRWVFQDWGWVTPFIFVDSELAFMLGRLTQGWPKGLAQWLPQGVSPWMEDPCARTPIVSVGAKVFSQLYTGQAQQVRPFLEIAASPPASPFTYPPNLRSPYAPWEAIANTASALGGFSRDALGFLNGLGAMPVHAGSDPANYARMALKMGVMMNPFLAQGAANTLNLKQFRNADSPKDYCYQALTKGPMRVTSLNAMGLLDDASIFAGNVSGGYSLHLYRWPSLPIIETLGLQVTRQWQADGVEVAALEPVLPFWYDVDMLYEPAVNVAWRSEDRIWHAEDGQTYPPNGGVKDPLEGYYNTSLGAFTQEATGPYRFTSTERVLPLLAKREALQTFLDSYVNDLLHHQTPAPVRWRFRVWAPEAADLAYVYLMVSSYDTTSSGSDNIGDWASQQVSFMVPVILEQEIEDRWETRSTGLFPAFAYVNNAMAAVTLAEVDGIVTSSGAFILPPSSWSTNHAAAQSLLKVETEVVPALNVGQGAVRRVILEVNRGEMTEGWPRERVKAAADQWAGLLSGELDRKWSTQQRGSEGGGDGTAPPAARSWVDDALELSMAVLANKEPWNVFTLKQFRDATDPDAACYQSIVKIPCVIDHVFDLREMDEPLHLRIHEYPTQPIVRLLGLVSTLSVEQDGGVVYKLLPVRPFWLRMDWTQELGQNLWVRSGSARWHHGKPFTSKPFGMYFGPGDRQLDVGSGLVEFVDRMSDDPDMAFRAWQEWRDHDDDDARKVKLMWLSEATTVVETLDPQMIIEAILSREWYNQDTESKSRREAGKLGRELDEQLANLTTDEARATEEIAFYRKAIDGVRTNDRREHMKEEIDLLELFERSALQLACAVSTKDPEEAQRALHQGIWGIKNASAHIPANDMELADLRQHIRQMLGTDDPTTLELALPVPLASSPTTIAALARVVREVLKRRRDDVLDEMAKALAQKPDFCVRRHAIGSKEDQDRLFPIDESWDWQWYLGPTAGLDR